MARPGYSFRYLTGSPPPSMQLPSVELHDDVLARVAGDDVPGGRAVERGKVVGVGVIADVHALRLELLGQDVEPLGVPEPGVLRVLLIAWSQGTMTYLLPRILLNSIVAASLSSARSASACACRSRRCHCRRASCGCPWRRGRSSPRTRRPGSPSSRPSPACRAGPSRPRCGPSRPAGQPGSSASLPRSHCFLPFLHAARAEDAQGRDRRGGRQETATGQIRVVRLCLHAPSPHRQLTWTRFRRRILRLFPTWTPEIVVADLPSPSNPKETATASVRPPSPLCPCCHAGRRPAPLQSWPTALQ